jgi:hypothetical protein
VKTPAVHLTNGELRVKDHAWAALGSPTVGDHLFVATGGDERIIRISGVATYGSEVHVQSTGLDAPKAETSAEIVGVER